MGVVPTSGRDELDFDLALEQLHFLWNVFELVAVVNSTPNIDPHNLWILLAANKELELVNFDPFKMLKHNLQTFFEIIWLLDED